MVRCVGCGAAVSEWAACCPCCRADLADAVPIRPASHHPGPPCHPDPPAPTGADRATADGAATDRAADRAAGVGGAAGNRRRLTRPVLALVAAVLAVIGTGSGLSLASDLTGRGTSAGPGGAGPGALLGAGTLRSDVVVYSGPAGVRVVPVDDRRPIYLSGAPTGPAEQTSAGTVFVQGGTAYLLAPPYAGPPRPLLQADGLFPMLWPGVVGAERDAGPGQVEASFVDLQDGHPSHSPWWVFPAGYRPISQLLASGPGGAVLPWQPADGGVRFGASLGAAVSVMTSATPEVAWLSARGCAPDGECLLHVDNLNADDPGDGRVVPPPAGHAGYLPGGALSPDGQQMAAFVADPPGHPHQAELVIIDTDRAQATVVPDSLVPLAGGWPAAGWTPDGAFVLFSGAGGSMHLYRPGSSRAFPLHQAASDSFAVG